MNIKLFLGIVLVIALLITIVVGDNDEDKVFSGGRSGGGGFGGDWEMTNNPGFCIEMIENKTVIKEVM